MIRIAAETDVPEMLAIYGPYVQSTTATFEYEVPSAEEFLRRFRSITAQFPWLVWEEEGKILGYAYGSAPFERAAYRWCAEDSVYLRPEARGRGIGKELCAALERILARQGYQVVYAIITSENSDSLAFHEKIGYKKTAEFPNCGYKFGRWLGVTWMEKRLAAAAFSESFPKNWLSIMQDDKKNFYFLG